MQFFSCSSWIQDSHINNDFLALKVDSVPASTLFGSSATTGYMQHIVFTVVQRQSGTFCSNGIESVFYLNGVVQSSNCALSSRMSWYCLLKIFSENVELQVSVFVKFCLGWCNSCLGRIYVFDCNIRKIFEVSTLLRFLDANNWSSSNFTVALQKYKIISMPSFRIRYRCHSILET